MLDDILEEITAFIFSIDKFSEVPLRQRESILTLHNLISDFLRNAFGLISEKVEIEYGYEQTIRKRRKVKRRIATPDGISIFDLKVKGLRIYVIYEHKNGKAAKHAYRQLLTYVLVQARKINPKKYQYPIIYGLGISYGCRITLKLFAQRFNEYISICNRNCCYLLNVHQIKRDLKEFDGSRSLRKFLMEKYKEMYLIDGGAESEDHSISSICTL